MSNGQTLSTNLMATALDWAERQKDSKEWGHLDMNRVAAAGQSCGGMEAAVMALDKRIKTLGIFNSGSMIGGSLGKALGSLLGGSLPIPNKGDIPDGSKFNVPTFFLMGGPRDVASAKVSCPFIIAAHNLNFALESPRLCSDASGCTSLGR
jgi:hypothetical protein